MLRSVVVAVAVVAASCSSPPGQDTTPNTTAPVATEVTTTTADRTIPAADWLSVSQEFGASLDGIRYRGGLNIVNGSDSVIAASFLMVEFLQNGVVSGNNAAILVEKGFPKLFLTPGDNWFAFSAGGRAPVDEVRLRPPEAEYADPAGSFDITVDTEPRSDGTLVSGIVASGWPSDAEGVFVHVVWFDAAGDPILGQFQLVIDVKAGESAAFTIDTSVRIEESWTYVTYGLEVLVTPAQHL